MGATVLHALYRCVGGELDGLLSQGIYLIVILAGAVVPLLGGAELVGQWIVDGLLPCCASG